MPPNYFISLGALFFREATCLIISHLINLSYCKCGRPLLIVHINLDRQQDVLRVCASLCVRLTRLFVVFSEELMRAIDHELNITDTSASKI